MDKSLAEDHPQPFEYESFTPEDLEPRPFKAPPRHRVLWTLGILLLLILLAVLPPLISVNRYRKQISASISQSLGRPVHAGEITLNLLPFPGFTIKEFSVSDDPAFSSEPVIHAGSVMARLRWRSLWRRRVEFSRITLTDASVNLVRRERDGQWNLESILLQASRMPAAPTGQRGPGDRPRFPYIEATGARLNLRMGLEKLPVSLTDADFALWLPEADQYRIRLEARPARTDAAVTDTGIIRLEGTLGRAASLAQVPVDLHASWTAAPLGAASLVATGKDLGFRGELTFDSTLKGTMGDNTLETRLQLDRLRRADFIPARLLDADLTCSARALGNLHRLENLRCFWPSGLTLQGNVPDTLTPSTADLQAQLTGFPAAGLMDIVHLASARVAPTLSLAGTLDAHATCCNPETWLNSADFTITKAVLAEAGATPYLSSTITGQWQNGILQIAPLPLDLGGVKPAQLAIRLGETGYFLSLAGPAKRDRLQSLSAALPQLGDGLDESPSNSQDLNLNLISNRDWRGPQTWSPPEIISFAPVKHKARRPH